MDEIRNFRLQMCVLTFVERKSLLLYALSRNDLQSSHLVPHKMSKRTKNNIFIERQSIRIPPMCAKIGNCLFFRFLVDLCVCINLCRSLKVPRTLDLDQSLFGDSFFVAHFCGRHRVNPFWNRDHVSHSSQPKNKGFIFLKLFF